MKLTKNFDIKEFACHDGTQVPREYEDNVFELAKNLQVLRDYFGKPIKINSGYRTPKYNKSIGGAKYSQHKLAKAADIVIEGVHPHTVHYTIEKLIERGLMKDGGLGKYNSFTHYDIRDAHARWNG